MRGTRVVPEHRPTGLSPRMRGNQAATIRQKPDHGSIPAHAGEPSLEARSGCYTTVYPRACGGTTAEAVRGLSVRGLSPRMRGNLRRGVVASAWVGSIPAHAGEPEVDRFQGVDGRVYPRACGGTPGHVSRQFRCVGLSPRMRGNQHQARPTSSPTGSIPAHAGEPSFRPSSTTTPRVYPRACGGTVSQNEAKNRRQGLSPRMRGNHGVRSRVELRVGSIPAHAGEPHPRPWPAPWIWVYPRACGGTWALKGLSRKSWGLSPRMRGNRVVKAHAEDIKGSIPAHAGEPSIRRRCREHRRVYPRACGGTIMLGSVQPLDKGLSPRMRGNPGTKRGARQWTRSIPAHAGEP